MPLLSFYSIYCTDGWSYCEVTSKYGIKYPYVLHTPHTFPTYPNIIFISLPLPYYSRLAPYNGEGWIEES